MNEIMLFRSAPTDTLITMFIWFPDNTPTAGSVKSRINITQNIAQQIKNEARVRRYFATLKNADLVFRPKPTERLSVDYFLLHKLPYSQRIAHQRHLSAGCDC